MSNLNDGSSVTDPYGPTLGLDEFARWTRQALAPYGFAADNALPLLGVCRDELTFAAEAAIQREWSAAFGMSGLGAMVFLGASGLAAAANHAPGLDGRRRYLMIVLPHIGLDKSGADGNDGVGRVSRPGQAEESTACGALIGLRSQLAAGNTSIELDPDDLEMSLLRMQIVPLIAPGHVPDLIVLTDIVRRRATDEVVRLAHGLGVDAHADVAVISGVLIHHLDGDRVAVIEAWISLRDDPTRIALI